jgi:recombination protein RecT
MGDSGRTKQKQKSLKRLQSKGDIKMAGKIQNQVATTNNQAKAPEQKTVNQLMSSILDGEKMRSRFDELLGKRAPQFISSIVSLVNADDKMQQAFFEAPMSVVQAGLKAATFDLPVDQNLGYAYIVPFKNKGIMTATFILGWKGMHQLAMRTGSYKTINVVDVRKGELKSYNRLTEDIEIEFVEDEDEREKLEVVGYVGYYRLVNGAEKTIYMTIKQITAHEKKHRKGEYMGKGWREDWDAMARKTVYRQLIGKWGVMSIDYQSHEEAEKLATQMQEEFNLENPKDSAVEAEFTEVNQGTGEVIENEAVTE